MNRGLTIIVVSMIAIFASMQESYAQESLTILETDSAQVSVNVDLAELQINAEMEFAIPFSERVVAVCIGTSGFLIEVGCGDDENAHRGRIQIQGPDMDEEISWAWAQDTPPTKEDGLRELDKLYDSLTDKQKKARRDAYAKARKWIRNRPEAGVDARVSQSWGNKDDSKKRIDIEVIKGKAFTGKDPEADDDSAIDIEGF